MESDQKYNGWTNYATWRVNLEFCDDITSSLDEETFDTVQDLADYLESTVEELLDEAIPDGDGWGAVQAFKGYVNAFLEDVDWIEIAESNAEEWVKDEEGDGDEKEGEGNDGNEKATED